MPAVNSGVVGCVSEMLRTKTITAMVTRSTGTVVETFPTIVTTSTTSYFSSTENTAAATVLDTALPETTQPSWTNTSWRTGVDDESPISRDTTGPATPVVGGATSATTTSDATTTDSPTSGMAAISVTTAPKDDTRSGSPDPETTDDKGVFLNHGSRTTASLATILTLSIASTLTVTRTVNAECTCT
ncbi:hypothetical protein ACHAPJ_006941 [Fusarium lateritium]